MKPLINKLKKIRTEKNITQIELNSRIGYTDSLVSRWECGDRSPSAFALFAWVEALGYELTIQPKHNDE
tara:strand:+ start:574 stop:780 length:207 start_codon:yes stop_codon:yes gene_type:complete